MTKLFKALQAATHGAAQDFAASYAAHRAAETEDPLTSRGEKLSALRAEARKFGGFEPQEVIENEQTETSNAVEQTTSAGTRAA